MKIGELRKALDGLDAEIEVEVHISEPEGNKVVIASATHIEHMFGGSVNTGYTYRRVALKGYQ